MASDTQDLEGTHAAAAGGEAPAPDDDLALLPGKRVRELLGVSEMTLFRWRRDPALGFPQPIVIQRRTYWRRRDLRRWLAERAAQGAGP